MRKQHVKKAATPRPRQSTAAGRSRASRESTTEQILDAAQELYATRAPHAVTVREVAEKAGVTHALVHQYVGSKDDLFNAVIQRGAPQRGQLIRDNPDFRAVLPLLFADILDRTVHSRAQLRSAMDGVEYASLETPIENGRMFVALARDAVASGAMPRRSCRGVDPRIAAAAAMALAYGWVAGGDWFVPLFDLEDMETEELQRQLSHVAECIGEMIFPDPETQG